MKTEDRRNLSRAAQRIAVDFRQATGSGDTLRWGSWQTCWQACVDHVALNAGARPNEAMIYFPELRWHDTPPLKTGDMVRVRTDQVAASQRSTLFMGFVTRRSRSFHGSSGSDPAGGGSHERNFVLARDHRWLLAQSSHLYGQIGRGEDDYDGYDTDSPTPKAGAFTRFEGRRCVFNPASTKNRDAVLLTRIVAGQSVAIPIFRDIGKDDDAGRAWWTARQMIEYILSPLNNQAYGVLPITQPANLVGLSHSDWNKILYGVAVEGLNLVEAVAFVASQLGWSFREDYFYGSPQVTFYKVGSASGYYARGASPVISHELYAPKVGEVISAVVRASGPKLLAHLDIDEDVDGLVNEPWGLGAPHEFEITAPLVPAWKDADLPAGHIDTARPFWTEEQCISNSAAVASDFHRYYHARGAAFRHNVARKFALNEAGDYSGGAYDRGRPFDFKTVLPERFQRTPEGRLAWGRFKRRFIDPLTLDALSLSRAPVRLEFSFDSGATWHVLPCAFRVLSDEAAIRLEEPNLSSIADDATETVGGTGALKDKPRNFWTMLCDDRLEGRVFKTGGWKTRVRITATVRMDQRLAYCLPPGPANGSPFLQSRIYDMSDRYAVRKRTDSSAYRATISRAWQQDNSALAEGGDGRIVDHLAAIQEANQDLSISGRFILDRLWCGDGTGLCNFACGDGIARIAGRGVAFSTDLASSGIRPEVIQVAYDVLRQQTVLLTRDMRFAEVRQ